MKTIELWYNGPNNEELAAALDSMTLEERKEMEKKMNGLIGNMSFTCMTDRLLAQDFFVKGYLSFSMKHLTEEEKKAQYEHLKRL